MYLRYRINLLIPHYKIHNHPCVLKHATYPATWPLQPPRHMNIRPLVEHSPTYLPTHTHTAYTHIYMPSHLVPPRPHTRLKVTFHQPSPTITPLPPTAIYYLPTIITRRQLAASSRCSVFSNRLNSFRKLVYISIYQPYQYITRISTFVSFISTSFSISMSTALMCAQ